MTDDELFEAHIKSTAWYGVLSQAAKDDDEGASVFRMARMAAHEAWSASQALVEQQAAEIDDLKHDIERHIANHAADLNSADTVAPAVDAPTTGAVYQQCLDPIGGRWVDVSLETYNMLGCNNRVLYTHPASEPKPAIDAQPAAWLVTGGKTFVDRAFITEAHADKSIAERKDGAHKVPLGRIDASAQSEGWRKDAVRREALEEIGQALTAAGEHSAYEIVYRGLSQKEPQ